jgi:SHS2 domain-containing protein
MTPIRVIEDGASADFEFEAFAESLESLFIECGKAVFMAISELRLIESKIPVEFNLNADSLEDLLFGFLSELIYLKDTKKMLFSKFIVEISGNYSLYCKAIGEPIDRDKHQPKIDVKAATYHKLKIEINDSGYYKVRVILDL